MRKNIKNLMYVIELYKDSVILRLKKAPNINEKKYKIRSTF
jgi:hypothetical protein